MPLNEEMTIYYLLFTYWLFPLFKLSLGRFVEGLSIIHA